MNFLFRHYRPILGKPILSLLFISGVCMFAYNMFSPIYAIFVEKIGGSITTASTSIAVYLAVAGIFTFIVGGFENKIKEKGLAIMWSQFIASFGYLLYYFTHNIFMLYCVQIILGISQAIYWPAFHSVFAIHTDRSHATTQWSIYDGLAYLIPAFGAGFGGWLVNLYGFQIIFLIMSSLSFVVGLFILFLPRKVL